MYGDLIRVDTDTTPEVLQRVSLDAGTSEGGIAEAELQDLMFRHPRALPLAAIDAAYEDAVPVCKELATPSGYVDALYANRLGRLTIAEFKLWRNPQARREVIGQILDYAKDLAAWGYEDLQREVSKRLGKHGNALYDLVREHNPDLNEAEFVDNVSRHLRRGEFLLLVVGDGIQQGAANIVDFVQRYSGLHFNLAMVEAALYRDRANHLIVQPRVLAKTEIVQRFVIEGGSVDDVAAANAEEQQDTMSDQEEQNLRFWTAVVRGFSFADVTVDVPAPTKYALLSVKVRNSGFGDWALSFNGYLYRRTPSMGCYLSARKDQPRAVRISDDICAKLDDHRQTGCGRDLEVWENTQGRPRIGYWRQADLSFLAKGEKNAEFRDAVEWMRERLDRLVSGLHPSIQSMLAKER
ncbi:MAG: DUF4268 domain-containing protein [Deltaproteobacteria bacterium]|nr:DUF4268 domain-containing protein [Deltaproteobacteria bacterium]